MIEIVSIMSNLVIAFLGIVAPIIILLISLFQAGLAQLRYQYENQRKQSEHKLKEQLDAASKAESTDLENIKKTIDELEKTKKRATSQLSILNPRNQIIRIFSPLFLSLVTIVIVKIVYKELLNSINIEKYGLQDIFISYVLIALSISLFLYSIYSIWKLLNVLIEIKANVDKEAEERENKKLDILSSILSMTSRAYLNKVYPTIDSKVIKSDKEQIKLTINEKRELPIAIVNNEENMAKNVEIGFIFNYDFIIESSKKYSLFSDEEEQVVRYEEGMIHGNTRFYFSKSPLIITPIKSGKFEVRTFIKGENVPAKYYKVKFLVD